MITRSRLRRWHVWLGWIVALPFLFWTVSGLVMVWKPIEEVRGNHLMAAPQPMRLQGVAVPPAMADVPLSSLKLEQRAKGPRWVIALPDGTTRLADPASGELLPPLSASEAVDEVSARYAGKAKVRSVARTEPARPPIDLRRPIAAWKVSMTDGTHFYVDAGSGEVVAKRTAWWRFYDLMWGVHIMDLKTREDTHNPLVLAFGALAAGMTVLALVLLPLTINRRRRKVVRQS